MQRTGRAMRSVLSVIGSFWLAVSAVMYSAGLCSAEQVANGHPLEFIDTGFENASPLWWDFADDGTVRVHLMYDHERGAPNRAAGHIHFQLQARPDAKMTLEFVNLANVYNGRPGSVASELKSLVVSTDGRTWTPLATRSLPGDRVLLDVVMPGPRLYVARVEPYRLSDLERLLAEIKEDPRVSIQTIGKTVQGRELEMLRVGDPQAPFRVVVRARAHPWEAGSNWVAEGLLRRLLHDDDEARQFRDCYCMYLMPMANKDGVAHGRTRFNLNGIDLNRNWDEPADRSTAPENHALETWLLEMIRNGQRPNFVLEIHNDGNGALHLNSPPLAYRDEYYNRMQTFEELLRKHTWFSRGSTRNMHSIGTLPNGWQDRFGIDGAVHEFNCQWIAALKEPPLRQHWLQYGEGLARVLYDYLLAVNQPAAPTAKSGLQQGEAPPASGRNLP